MYSRRGKWLEQKHMVQRKPYGWAPQVIEHLLREIAKQEVESNQTGNGVRPDRSGMLGVFALPKSNRNILIV